MNSDHSGFLLVKYYSKLYMTTFKFVKLMFATIHRRCHKKDNCFSHCLKNLLTLEAEQSKNSEIFEACPTVLLKLVLVLLKLVHI